LLARRRRPERVIDRAYGAWLAKHAAPDPAAWRRRGAAPRISVVMPVCDTNPVWLRAAIASVRAQYYDNWELVIADDASSSPHVATCLAELEADPRISVVRLKARGGIAAATNAALRHADGAYVAFLDHDDILAPHALAAVACAIAENPALDLVFSDEDQLIDGRRAQPYFKPGCNPDLLLSQNVICHLAVYRRALLAELGGLRHDVDGAQDHDLALRAMASIAPDRAKHLPLVLYSWRQSEKSFSAAATDRCRAAALRAVSRHLEGRARVTADPALPQWPSVRFNLPPAPPRVSLIGADAIDVAADDYEPTLLQHVPNAAAATGDVLLFLSPKLRPAGPGWLRELVAQACRPEIGAAGGLLLAPRGGWAHTGYALHPKHIAQTLAPPSDPDDPGYRGQFRLARTVSAVSLDCLAVRGAALNEAGGLTPEAADFAAVDFCLKLAARGLRTVWTPHARLRYAALPRPPSAGAAWMRQHWGATLAADPYHNPNLLLSRGRITLGGP
jgi:GT2 family glycosyltransferase